MSKKPNSKSKSKTTKSKLAAFEARMAKRADPVAPATPAAPTDDPQDPQQPAEEKALSFFPYPDSTWCKFTSEKDAPGVFVICMNTESTEKPNLHKIAASQNYGLANMLTEAVNLLMAYRTALQKQAEEAKAPSPEEICQAEHNAKPVIPES